ncbi:hypothetical protein SAY87_025993 [Trapa incisa]|uniref:65-kDa microtubule-associated protein 5 n=1 Tax=Trapa incisa TaxID=236973 RepID=A0AAN7GME4_9MYRT|nr:hypothetical protein SAY87_025993 [Trapa incisa]
MVGRDLGADIRALNLPDMAAVLPSFSPSHTTCSTLLHELQIIWDEIGESDSQRDKMLQQLEQECLDIYRRKVEETRKHKADLHQLLAESEAEIVNLISTLGERSSFAWAGASTVKGTLKEQLLVVSPILEDLRSKKEERMKEFGEIQTQIAQIYAEIAGNNEPLINSIDPQVDRHDLTWTKLKELKSYIQELQSEKFIRLQKVNGHIHTIHQFSVVLSFDFYEAINEIHPSLTGQVTDHSKSISNDTLASLTSTINSLKQEKEERLNKIQKFARELVELWDLLDTPAEEKKKFDHVVGLISSSVDEVSMPGSLAMEMIEQVEIEVERLYIVKASKMKELIMKRQKELEEIYKGMHMDVDSDSASKTLISLIDSGTVVLSDLLANMDDQISKAKEQASSRRDILDKVEKWQHASVEERWLDDYEKDENRYSAGRGAHKNLKRAEKARILASKIPSMLDSLKLKTKSWESEKGIPFLYNKVPLLHILEEYTIQRHEREEEKRKSREQKRLQEQLATEQAIYGSRPSAKKPLGLSMNANNLPSTPGRRGATPGRYGLSSGKERRQTGGRANALIPINYVALPKDENNTH